MPGQPGGGESESQRAPSRQTPKLNRTRGEKLPEAFFEFSVSPSPEKAVFRLTDPAKIAEARALAGRSKIIVGTVLKEPAYYNRPWRFHIDPESARVAIDQAVKISFEPGS